MKTVNIYDYFKLFDVGVQATPLTAQKATQNEHKALKDAEVMTHVVRTVEHECQTATRNDSRPGTTF